MIDKSQYTQIKAKTSLTTSRNQFGDIIDSKVIRTTVHRKRLVNTGGMRLYWVNKLNKALEDVISSNKDFRIVNYMITNQSASGFVKNSSSQPASVEYIATKFEVTTRKVSGLLKQLIEANVIKKSGRTIYLNPYYVLPYGNSEDANYILQLKWDHDYKYTEEQLREKFSTELTTNREVEV